MCSKTLLSVLFIVFENNILRLYMQYYLLHNKYMKYCCNILPYTLPCIPWNMIHRNVNRIYPVFDVISHSPSYAWPKILPEWLVISKSKNPMQVIMSQIKDVIFRLRLGHPWSFVTLVWHCTHYPCF